MVGLWVNSLSFQFITASVLSTRVVTVSTLQDGEEI